MNLASLDPAARPASGAAQFFLASGCTAVSLRVLAQRRGDNRPRVERVADAMADLERAA